MARPIRLEFPDAVYHVTAHGNEREEIVRDDHDREQFLEALEEMVRRFGVVLHAYCLLPNHYHLVLETPRANLSAGVGWLQTAYSIRFNRRHQRNGHLYQGRFKAHLVEEDAYAQELVKYIHLNPVRSADKHAPIPAERRRELDRYRWSSHRAYAGMLGKSCPAWLCLEWQRYFGRTRPAAELEYRRLIDQAFGQAVRSPWEDLRQGLVLGGKSFWNKARKLLVEVSGEEEVRRRRRANASESSRLIASLVENEVDRRVGIWIQARLGGRRMTELAKEYGYSDGSGIHRVVHRLEEEAKHDDALAQRMKALSVEASRVKS